MSVHFTPERMDEVFEAHDKWWKRELDRPLVKVTIADASPRAETEAPALSQASCMDLKWSPEQVIEATDEELSCQEYLGDAFPIVNFDAFGPGVVAAFAGGAKLDNHTGKVWFVAPDREIEDIHVSYNPDNEVLRRIKALYRAGLERWHGEVVMSLPDLGGVMDIAATLRGSQNLLMDCIEAPEEVSRLCGEIETAWYEAYNDLFGALSAQKYNTNWSGLLSKKTSYIVQCDFGFMISNPMYRQFALETIRRDTQRLSNVVYHLDGVGQLRHLDDLLAIEDLKAIQWVFGEGQPQAEHWIDVYQRITAGGKPYQICGEPINCLRVIRKLHGAPYVNVTMKAADRALAEELLEAR